MNMSDFWMVSYIVLWLLAIGMGLVVLALAREIESLHTRLDWLQKYLGRSDFGGDGREQAGQPAGNLIETEERVH